MQKESLHTRPPTCLLSGEFCDRTLERRYRLASYETYRRQTWQVATLVLIALTALNLVDYLYATGGGEVMTFTLLRYGMLALPAAMIWMAVRRADYRIIDWTVLAFALWVIADSVLMIYIFRNDPVMMAARLPLYAMIANIMFSPGQQQRMIMNVIALPVFLLAFWTLTPDPLSVVPVITVILSVAFMFGITAGTWLIRLRRYDYYRAAEQDRTNANLNRYKHELEEAILAKSMFLSNVSHELRTPLNAIIGFSDMLEMQMFGPIGSPKYKEYVGDIRNSGRHLLGLIDDILDLNRLEAGKSIMTPEWIRFSEAAAECRKMVLAAHGQIRPGRIVIDASCDPSIHFDPRALHQILVNLVTNSVKYAGEDAVIRISAELPRTDGAVLVVSDDGSGMDHDTITRLMRPFEQADAITARMTGGWGLGLPLANALAVANDGRLAMQSAPGEGTTVRLYLKPDAVLVEALPTRRENALLA